MKLKILYFGVLTDLTGKVSEELDAHVVTDINKLADYLHSAYPALGNQKYKIAVNNHIVEGDFPLNNGDEVAFLPPFAGG